MDLAGQDNRGYAMAALLVGMAVMAVLMSALLPVWTTMATREKEAELVFRGNQYARAIGLFQRKFANTPPPTIDVLVEQRFLRKKYKDPITNDDFQPLYANQAMAPGGPQGSQGPSGTQRPSGTQSSSGTQGTAGTSGSPRPPGGQLIQPGFGATGATAAGGIIGVTSKSKETSLRVYNGRTKYNEWAFVYVQTSQRPGESGGGGSTPGMPGNPTQRPGQPGPASPFGRPPGAVPNPAQRGPGMAMPPPPPGFPTRPAFPGPGGPGTFSSPNGETTFTPVTPQPRPPGQRPPGQ
jgi:type II secretory pathway pseudopilin PulG